MAEEDYVSSVMDLHKEKNWRKIINNCSDDNDHSRLLWVFPSEENITFIGDALKNNNCQNVISVGCGTGLLEWILMEALGIKVIGLEVDGAWWDCKYAPKAFIPLHLAKFHLEDDPVTQNLFKAQNQALLFCYFNNGPAFEDYVKYFDSDMIFIIGPGEGRNTHTNPTPFDPNLGAEWKLTNSQEVRDTKDFIAVYQRC